MNFSALDRFLESLLNDLHLPMYDLTVHVRGEEIYRRQGGFIDCENRIAHRPNTRYFLYSVSKPVTCAAALTLFEEGKYLLTDPLSKYLPEFADVQVETVLPDKTKTLRAPARPILIRDLFTMCAGFTYNLGSANIRTAIQADPRARTRDVIRALAKDPLIFDPGTSFQYSLCHDILAAFVEEVAGERFSEYVRRVIFEPLGMSSSGYHFSDEELTATMAQQYTQSGFGAIPTVVGRKNSLVPGPEYDSGGAGIISTPEDYIKFADMLANGGIGTNGARILAPATIELMRTNFLTDKQLLPFQRAFGNYNNGYGYGLGVRTVISRPEAGTIGPLGEFNWGGAAGSLAFFEPASGTAIFYAQHSLNPPEGYTLPTIRNLVFAALGK